MKKAQRDIYLQLANIELPEPFDGVLGLCNFCQYAEWLGYYCEDAELDCHHPLEVIRDYSDGIWEGDDCWGFRPEYSLEDITYMIGIYLRGKYPDMSQCKRKKAYHD